VTQSSAPLWLQLCRGCRLCDGEELDAVCVEGKHAACSHMTGHPANHILPGILLHVTGVFTSYCNSLAIHCNPGHHFLVAPQDPKTKEEQLFVTYMVMPHMVYQVLPNGTSIHRSV
jgi:hypothetical protein